ncbi:MAB_1171c family putative transporter [Embleya sp. NPDC059237]|uniref:MAB_1171c family putative transporter n=1 Tax=Embleya sp. NPDC059237 TaxID=3346784 RepID=UPI0036C9A9FD
MHVLELGVVVLAWVIVVWRRPTTDSSYRTRSLWGAFVALAVALTIRVPRVDDAIENITGVAQVGTLMKHVVGLVAMLLIVNWITALVSPTEEPPAFTSPRYITTGVMIGALVVLFFLIPDRDHDGDYFITDHAGDAVATAYQLVFVAGATLATGVGTLLVARAARPAPAGGLRRSLATLALGNLLGVGYCLLRAAYLLIAATDGAWPGGDDAFETASNAVKLTAIMLIIAGTSYSAFAAALRRWRQWVAMRRLYALWWALTEAVPHVVLCGENEPGEYSPVELTYRLHRRGIEIRDAALTLRDTAPPGLHRDVVLAVERAEVPEDQRAAVAEAYWLKEVLRLAEQGITASGDLSYTPHPAAESEAETAWLVRVARAFASPTMRRVEDAIPEKAT